ncbi:hypothetical protein BDB00DRAFT_316505 [Zychaea mexicana]|uniref:uncharacterized protein n=1 Tax=Zychaea mexicana TaxID=64656 RepID=UPI0022FE9914|nr:uncharacterized protein BDB00DRAFT_316505 [Zychaea mexicana]KAI9467425.1 hypothetical protein BDB00DRAFT_316505 [Zychaea mexicana]
MSCICLHIFLLIHNLVGDGRVAWLYLTYPMILHKYSLKILHYFHKGQVYCQYNIHITVIMVTPIASGSLSSVYRHSLPST